MAATHDLPPVRLDDKYVADSGRVLMTGTQALVRLLLDQRRLDAERGLNTGMFVSGYPGSPLGGLDKEINVASRHLGPAGVVFQPGVNEELAATAVGGTQLIGELPGRRHDGVVGIWFGKNPGLDRAADAIRHGNVSGTAHLGGAVAMVGDDPLCKSSTLPSSCEAMCRSLLMPVLAPGGVGDLVRLGLHAIALSRHSGLWTALKIVSDVADAAAIVDVGGVFEDIPMPPATSRGKPPVLLAPQSVDAEHDLMTARLDRARGYGRDTGLNRVVFEPQRAALALVAAGVSFTTLRRALDDLDFDDAALDAAGIRLVRLDMPWPLHPEDVKAFAAGVDELLVIEDKLPFVEEQLRSMLYRTPGAPLIVGKEDEHGHALLPSRAAVGADDVTRALLARLPGDSLPAPARDRAVGLRLRVQSVSGTPDLLKRTPYFCSGCPHNLSTMAPADQLVGAGIGCHALVALDPSKQRGTLVGAPQMGGEGAQWLGMAPFTDDRHYIQNLGDGTFHHSGSLAIRATVAAGVNLTYKLLYNDAIAMTGGQQAPGRLDVPTLTRWLALEGVARTIVTTEDPHTFAGVALATNAEVRHRDRLAESEAELAAIPGTTVLLHTDRCATEERRLRKRGKLPAPADRVWINERVCEGCGDCGSKSTCLSVLPVETELGRKTQIHQSSCTQDFSCLKGDCPSFVMVRPGRGGAKRPEPAPELPVELPEPWPRVPDDVLIRMPGVGGTGVVTLSQTLQMAAMLDGRWASGLDQTGLAQKGGPVVSDVRIARSEPAGAARAATGTVDVLLGLDLLGAAARDTLLVADPGRTVAVLNTHAAPTASLITGATSGFPGRAAIRAVEGATRAGEMASLDAQRIAERLFSDHMPTNTVMLGAAYQHGCVPISAAAIEEAIRLNGAAVEANLTAFDWGRAAVVSPDAVEAALRLAQPAPPPPDRATQQMLDGAGCEGELRRLLEVRVADLVGYQSRRYARAYLDEVMRVAAVERERSPDGALTVAEAYARGLYKLMAYKDEYEVARLHLDALEQAKLSAAFGPRAKARVMLHPPALRALGLKRKISLGPATGPVFRALRAGKRLRGTALDPFGFAEVRRVERALVGEYRELLWAALELLGPRTHTRVAAIAGLPDVVRGYEQIKLANVERFRADGERMLGELRAAQGGDAA